MTLCKKGRCQIFYLEKRIQLIKTVRLNTQIDIFGEKNLGRVKKSHFSINNMKFAEKFIYEIKLDENDFSIVFWLLLAKKTHFGNPIDLQKISCAPLKLSHQDTSFEYLYDNIWSDYFFDQKVAESAETPKFRQNRLNYLILHWASYS